MTTQPLSIGSRLAPILAMAGGVIAAFAAAQRVRAATDVPGVVGDGPLAGLLTLLADPNVAFILFTLGLVGLLLELVHTNLATGILGGIALLLAVVGFGSLPVNVAGLLLIALGLALFVLETRFVSHGLLTIGGVIGFAAGASILYAPPGQAPTTPLVQVAPPLIVVVTAASAALMLLVTLMAVRSRAMLATAGTVGTPVIAGSTGTVQAPLAPLGTVHLAGETWSARTADGRVLDRGVAVRLTGFDELVAIVEPLAVDSGITPPRPALPADLT